MNSIAIATYSIIWALVQQAVFDQSQDIPTVTLTVTLLCSHLCFNIALLCSHRFFNEHLISFSPLLQGSPYHVLAIKLRVTLLHSHHCFNFTLAMFSSRCSFKIALLYSISTVTLLVALLGPIFILLCRHRHLWQKTQLHLEISSCDNI